MLPEGRQYDLFQVSRNRSKYVFAKDKLQSSLWVPSQGLLFTCLVIIVTASIIRGSGRSAINERKAAQGLATPPGGASISAVKGNLSPRTRWRVICRKKIRVRQWSLRRDRIE